MIKGKILWQGKSRSKDTSWMGVMVIHMGEEVTLG